MLGALRREGAVQWSWDPFRSSDIRPSSLNAKSFYFYLGRRILTALTQWSYWAFCNVSNLGDFTMMKRKFPLLCSFEQCFPGVIVAALFLISLGSMSRYQEVAGLHNRNLFSSKFWRLEVEEGEASKVGFWGSLPLRVDYSFPAVSPLGLCMWTDRHSHRPVSSSFWKDTSFIPLGRHPYDLIEFNYPP